MYCWITAETAEWAEWQQSEGQVCKMYQNSHLQHLWYRAQIGRNDTIVRLSQSIYRARNLCQFVIRVSQEQFIRFTSHLTDLLLRSHKSAVLKLVQFGHENWEQSVNTTLMWSHGEADVNQMEISMVQHQFAVVTCSKQEPNVKQVSVSGETWSTRSNLQQNWKWDFKVLSTFVC